MRVAPIVVLSTVALATLLLAGCTDGAKTSTAATAAPVDLCAVAAPSGPASDAVAVEGRVGSPASVTLPAPLTITSAERTVVVEGAGEAIDSGSLVDYAMTVYDAATGAELQSQGYEGPPTPPVAAQAVGQFLGCATVGSRIVVAVPATELEVASVWVLDVLDAKAARATGEEQQPMDGMPTVELAGDGAPSVSVPGGDPPATTRVAVLKKGDGAVVAPGDSVTVHYEGVRWSNALVFDSSWRNGTPSALITTDLIPGYREAIEGQSVGSQVLVVIPPESAYGEGEVNEDDLTGETLVFVIDILDTLPAS